MAIQDVTGLPSLIGRRIRLVGIVVIRFRAIVSAFVGNGSTYFDWNGQFRPRFSLVPYRDQLRPRIDAARLTITTLCQDIKYTPAFDAVVISAGDVRSGHTAVMKA